MSSTPISSVSSSSTSPSTSSVLAATHTTHSVHAVDGCGGGGENGSGTSGLASCSGLGVGSNSSSSSCQHVGVGCASGGSSNAGHLSDTSDFLSEPNSSSSPFQSASSSHGDEHLDHLHLHHHHHHHHRSPYQQSNKQTVTHVRIAIILYRFARTIDLNLQDLSLYSSS